MMMMMMMMLMMMMISRMTCRPACTRQERGRTGACKRAGSSGLRGHKPPPGDEDVDDDVGDVDVEDEG